MKIIVILTTMLLSASCATAIQKYEIRYILAPDFEFHQMKNTAALSDTEKESLTQNKMENIRYGLKRLNSKDIDIKTQDNKIILHSKISVTPDYIKENIILNYHEFDLKFVNDEFSLLAADYVKNNSIVINDTSLSAVSRDIGGKIKLPETLEIKFYYEFDKNTKKYRALYPMALNKKSEMSGEQLRKAYSVSDEYGRPALHVETTEEGERTLAEITSRENQGKRLAIIVDQFILSAPAIMEQISGGKIQITGNFSQEEIDRLSNSINQSAGSKKLKLTIVKEEITPLISEKQGR
jgi:preprotein translocase subunit SecD